MKRLSLIYIAILSIFWSCSNHSNEKIKYIELKDWHILGPFESNDQSDYLQFNNLQNFGYDEENIDYESFIKIANNDGSTISAYKYDLNVIDFCKHFRIDPFDDNISGNAYAACIFDVKDTSGYYINFSSDDGGKVFLNNREIINLEKAGLLGKYEVYQPVKLNKGKNFILVKVNNGLYNWQAFVKIEKFSNEGLEEHYNLINKQNNNKFFNLSLYDTTSTLVPAQNLPDSKSKFTIFAPNNTPVYSGELYKNMNDYPNISSLPNGLYLVRLYINDLELTQDIFKGNLIEELNNIVSRIEKLSSPDPELKATIDANIFRLKHLLKPENRGNDKSEKQEWQRKLIYLYKTFSEIERNISSNNSVKEIPSTTLRGFVSKIDGKSQFYISHAPQNYDSNKKYPVVVFTPYFLATQRPYLESLRVADLDIQENLQYLSDKYQMIIIEPFCREVCWYNLNSIVETDFFEVLYSTISNYNVDTSRIFLAGSCKGADKALDLAVKYPHIFAGVALSSPAFSTNKSSNDGYRNDLHFDYIENIKEMPILVMHSENDRHTSIVNSQYLDQLAKENQLQHFTYIQTKNDVEEYFWYKFSDKIFEFFTELKQKDKVNETILKLRDLKYNTNQIITILEREKRDVCSIALDVKNNKINIESSNVNNFIIDLQKLTVDTKLPVSIVENGNLLYKGILEQNTFIKDSTQKSSDLQKNNLVEGPFTEIFTDQFIIVVGSIGTDEETKLNEKNAQYFKDAWKLKYFNECRTKYDYQITDSDINNANLFCIGNFKNNNILKEIEDDVPMSIFDEKIIIGSHSQTGENLNTYMIYPNPKNIAKYLGIFSGDVNDNVFKMMDIDINEFKGLLRLYEQDEPYFDVSCFGWYDYKIWDNSGNKLYSGYFNDNWEN